MVVSVSSVQARRVSTAQQRQQVRERVRRLAADTDGVLDRRQLYAAGVSRWQLEAELRAGRWSRGGRQTVLVHAGDPRRQRWRTALHEVGGGGALAGLTALELRGLTGLTEDVVHVAVPKSSRPRRSPGVDVHETRRYREDDVVGGPMRHVRPAAAAVQAALWAVSDRAAALFLIAPVQQRLCTGGEVAEALETVQRHRRRALLRGVVADVLGGVQSTGELDLARLLRRRGLPSPERQVLRRHPSGRVYLDARWDRYRVVVEVDGVQHRQGQAVVADALRDNELRLTGDTVLRVPAVALRTSPGPFLDQVERALRAAGWAAAA